MKTIQITSVGSPLVEHEVETPQPKAHEVLIKIKAAGMCHSDVHYRDGTGSVGFLPITPGHEIAGVVESIGSAVKNVQVGNRVAVHYLVTCGNCTYCMQGLEQFCQQVKMIGKDLNGGYAEYVAVPERNIIPVPDNIPMEIAAIMMCSTATAFHALKKARIAPGDFVAIFGAGGLGLSAIQLAKACGAHKIFAVDIAEDKRELAARFGAHTINPLEESPEKQIRALTGGRGVNIALEFTGIPRVQEQALASLGVQGRIALAGIGKEPFQVASYARVINREAEIIGVSDHKHSELLTLMGFANQGLIDINTVVEDVIPLDAARINEKLDDLAAFHSSARTVITP
jgi:propanol-preferring alcohol dehydrogenase